MKRLSFVVGNELYETWGVSRGFQGECTLLVGAALFSRYWECFISMETNSKWFLDMSLQGENEVQPIVWPLGHVTTSVGRL